MAACAVTELGSCAFDGHAVCFSSRFVDFFVCFLGANKAILLLTNLCCMSSMTKFVCCFFLKIVLYVFF